MKRFLAISAIVLFPVLAAGHTEHDTDAIKARRAYFTLIGANMAALGEMAKGKKAYDAELAQQHAGNLGFLADYASLLHFPRGTSTRDHPGKTRALPSIWDGPDGIAPDFVARAEAFVAAARQLAGASRAGVDALGAALAETGKTCKGCHDDYRAKDF